MGGGRDDIFHYLADDVFMWDLRDDMVIRRNQMPMEILDMAVVVYRDKIFGVGGLTNVYYTIDRNDDTLCYSITDDEWTILPLGYLPIT